MLGLFVRAVGLVLWTVLLPFHVLRRLWARTRAGSYLVVTLDGAVSELPPARRFWPSRAKPALSLYTLQTVLDAAARDRHVKGLVLVVRSMRAGSATAASLRAMLLGFREARKRVVVHLPSGGALAHLYVAMAADHALIGPRSDLLSVGILSATRYFRGALDKVGVVPEVIAHGRYKTAAEPIERSSMSAAQREQLGALIDSLYGEVVGAVASGRHVDEPAARALIDGAPYDGREAVAAGLFDHVAYDDELAGRVDPDGAKARLVAAEAWWRPRAALRPAILRSRGVLAVIRVHGTIVGDAGLPFRSLALDERVVSAVRLARLNPVVRGVVLHVNSPGGSALASDRMHHELAALAAEKPLVASLGDVAASGGYYVAAAAHAVVARPTTITGSIGVIAARIVLDPLLARLHIVTEVLARGARARLLDPWLPLSDDERSALERQIERTYRAFVRVVAEGRGRSEDEIDALAQGRVWSGEAAHARGLVDQLGGFDDAVGVLRKRIGRGAESLRVVTLRAPAGRLPALDPPERRHARWAARALEALDAQLPFDPRLLSLRGETVLTLDPVSANIRW